MKLGRWAILSIGFMIGLVALCWGFFLFWIPNSAEVKLLNKNKEDNDAEAAKMGAAQKRVKQATAMVDAKAAAWKAIVATRTPGTDIAHGGINLSVNPWQLSVDTPKFRDSIQRAVNEQVKKGGIKVVGSPLVQPIDANLSVNSILSTFYNFPPLKFPAVIFDFGTITVQGTYKQILDNVRAYKYMPHYLAVTDGLSITGTSPNLTGTYNLTVVGFIRTPTPIAPNVDEGAASSAGGMGGGMFGGGMGGRGMGGPAGLPGMSPPLGGGGKPKIGAAASGG